MSTNNSIIEGSELIAKHFADYFEQKIDYIKKDCIIDDKTYNGKGI